MFSSTVVILSLVLATLYAAAFHLLWGKTGRQLVITWLAALLGFGSGQVLGILVSLSDVMIGEVHMVAASAVSWLFMYLAKGLEL